MELEARLPHPHDVRKHVTCQPVAEQSMLTKTSGALDYSTVFHIRNKTQPQVL